MSSPAGLPSAVLPPRPSSLPYPQQIFTHQPLNRRFSIFPPPHPPFCQSSLGSRCTTMLLFFRYAVGDRFLLHATSVHFRVQAAVVGIGAPEAPLYFTFLPVVDEPIQYVLDTHRVDSTCLVAQRFRTINVNFKKKKRQRKSWKVGMMELEQCGR